MESKGRFSSHTISGVFIFFLIGLFALTSLTLTLVGTKVYQRINADAQANSDARLALSYLCNRVRTFDATGKIAVKEREGLSILCLYETYDEECYETAIYVSDGELRERFASAEDAFDPSDGEALLAVQSLDFEMPAQNLLEAKLQLANGETRTLRMALRASGGEAAS